MLNENQPTKIWNRDFIVIFVANLFIHLGQQATSALTPKYASVLGAPASVVGIVSGIFAISALLSRPVVGPAFDCFSKKKLLLIFLGFIAAGYIFFIFAPSVEFLIAGRLVVGVGVGASAPLLLSLACEALPKDQLGKGVSFFSLGQAVGQALGPSIGGSLTKSIGYPMTFACGFGMIVLGAVIACFAKDAPVPAGAKYRIRLDSIVTKEAFPPAILMVFIGASYASISGFLFVYGGLLGIENVGLYFTVYAVFLLVLRPISGVLCDKFGFGKVLAPAIVAFCGTFIVFSFATNITHFIIAAIFAALGYGICNPTIQAICMKLTPSEKRGVGSSTVFLGQDIGQFLGPWLGGLVADSIIASGTAEVTAYAIAYRCMVIPLLCALVIFFFVRKKIQ